MTYYDVAMAVVVIGGMVLGAWRGITWQLASIASLVLGYSVAHPLSNQLAPQFASLLGPKFADEPVVARVLGMVVVYVVVSGGVFLAAWAVRTTLRRMQFEAFDRHLGMLLGGLEAAMLGVVLTLFVVSFDKEVRGPIFASPTGQVVAKVMATLGPVLPSEARTVLAPFLEGPSPAVNTEDIAAAPSDSPAPTDAPKAGTTTSPASGAAPTTLGGLIEKEEEKISKAIVETAKDEIRQVGAGGTNDGNVERR